MSDPIDRDPFDPPVFISDALERRPAKPRDHLREKRALQELAGRMAHQPEEVMPRFVDLAMDMTGGIAAGISLYEETPPPGVFRWTYLRGAFARFEGSTTPRDFSPCGVTLDRMSPVLVAHPERMYDWLAQADVELPEVLLVPLHVDATRPLGTLWIVGGMGQFDGGDARALTELAGFIDIALCMVQAQQRLRQALETQEMLASELDHRAKNAFALIGSMIQLSKNSVSSPGELASVLSGRLRALAEAQALIHRKPGAAVSPAPDLGRLVRTITQPFDDAGGVSRFLIEGPPLRCRGDAVNGMALVFHELATNSAKYGALKAGAGRVDVAWRVEGDRLVVHWAERGGPPVAAPPDARGFGSRLVETIVTHQFRGDLVSEWQSGGLRATARLAMRSVAAPRETGAGI